MSGTLIPQVQPQNPFAQLGQTVQSINALQDFQAKRATADAYGQSIDPTTGAFDQGKFNALMASTPQGRWNIGPSMQQSGQAQDAEGTGIQSQVRAKQAQLNGIAGYMTPLVGQVLKGQPVTGQQVLDATNQAATAGFATPEMVSNIQKQVAQLGPNGDASNLVRGAYFATQTGQQQLQTLAPPSQQVSLGGSVGFVQPNPLGAGYNAAPGTNLPTTMGPEFRVTPLRIRMSDGSEQDVLPQNVPDFLKQNEGATVIGPSTSGQVTVGGFGPNNGRITPPAAAPTTSTPPATPPTAPTGKPPATPAPAPSATSVGPPPPVIAGRSQPTGAAASATVSTGLAGDLSAAANSSQQRQAVLSEMQSSLQGKEPVNTGPGSDWARTWSAVANRFPDNIASLVPGMTPQQVASYEGFVKMAETLRQLQSQQLAGTITNDKFASALASSPHAALSTLGNLGMVSILQGNEDAINAKNNAWTQAQADGWQPQNYQQWVAKFNQLPIADPRIYWLQHMSPDQRQKLVDGMGEAQRAALKQHYDAAAKAGAFSGGGG